MFFQQTNYRSKITPCAYIFNLIVLVIIECSLLLSFVLPQLEYCFFDIFSTQFYAYKQTPTSTEGWGSYSQDYKHLYCESERKSTMEQYCEDLCDYRTHFQFGGLFYLGSLLITAALIAVNGSFFVKHLICRNSRDNYLQKILPIFWLLNTCFAGIILILWFVIIKPSDIKSCQGDDDYSPVDAKLGGGIILAIIAVILVIFSALIQFTTIFIPLRSSRR